MNPATILVLCAGGIAGLGATLVLTAVLPFHPALPDALARIDERRARLRGQQSSVHPEAGVARRFLLAGLLRLPITVPDRDLEIIGWSRDRYLLGRAATTVGFAAVGPVLAATTVLIDAGLPIAVPAAFGVAAGAAGWASYARRSANDAAATSGWSPPPAS